MVRQRIFVTGIGIINPAGIGKEEFWRNITTGCSAIRSITRFDTTNHQIKVAGEIANFQPEDFISRRLIAKTDRFTHYALAAAELALIDANLDLKQEDPYRIGVWFGNNGGGWDTYEQALYQFYQEGPSMVNPLHANAWFSTAAQAYVSIYHNIRGCSKSFVCDRASGACGLYFGIKSIQQGDNDVVLAGGTEAPINELSFIFYHQTGELSPVTNPEKAYLPFDRDRTGLVLGEGSTILVLESEQHAIRRDAKIYGEIVSSSMTTELNPSSGLAFEQAMHQVLRDAGITSIDIDLVLAEGCGTQIGDRVEAAAITAALGKHAQNVPITVPKSLYGHTYGASCITEVACSLLSIETGKLPVTQKIKEKDTDCNLTFVTQPENHQITHTLVNSRAREGVNVSFVVGRNSANVR